MYLQEAELDRLPQPVHVNVWCTERAPQCISQSLTWRQKKHTELIAAITWIHKHTHTHTPLLSLFTPQLLRYVFVLCSCGSGSCLLMALFKTRPPCTIFCSLSCFLFVTSPLTWVCCAFSFGRLNVCFAACIGCFVQHIKRTYTHTHSASLSLRHLAVT